MGSVLGPFGAFQGNIWSVAPFIPVGPGKKGSKIEKWAFFEKSLFLCFFHRFSPGPTGIKGATDQMLP